MIELDGKAGTHETSQYVRKEVVNGSRAGQELPGAPSKSESVKLDSYCIDDTVVLNPQNIQPSLQPEG